MNVEEKPVLLWFRRDLRLSDNPSLRGAVETGRPVIPIFIFDDSESWPMGAASRWWLHHSLKALGRSLQLKNSRLIISRGATHLVLSEIVKTTRASEVFWNRVYEPALLEKEQALAERIKKIGCEPRRFSSSLLFDPSTLKTGQGKPYQVFTPFWNACVSAPPPKTPLLVPERWNSKGPWPSSDNLESLKLLSTVPWAKDFPSYWEPGEEGAEKKLKLFLNEPIEAYGDARNIPAQKGSSRLSPHLHFGEITPRQIWHKVKRAENKTKRPTFSKSAEIYLKEIGWREFAHHLLFHFPHTPNKPLRVAFEKFPWKKNSNHLDAWKKGCTGYPIVDAGMRELWATGWMHNRVRMVVASFLVKDLLISWQEGAEWFWDTLVDADLANNTLGWQWSAGCGADAAPYFRIFNPVTQGEKFDSDGRYVRKWIPELSRLSDKYIQAPWTAPKQELEKAGVFLGKNYPFPVVDHAEAREQALTAFRQIKAA